MPRKPMPKGCKTIYNREHMPFTQKILHVSVARVVGPYEDIQPQDYYASTKVMSPSLKSNHNDKPSAHDGNMNKFDTKPAKQVQVVSKPAKQVVSKQGPAKQVVSKPAKQVVSKQGPAKQVVSKQGPAKQVVSNAKTKALDVTNLPNDDKIKLFVKPKNQKKFWQFKIFKTGAVGKPSNVPPEKLKLLRQKEAGYPSKHSPVHMQGSSRNVGSLI